MPSTKQALVIMGLSLLMLTLVRSVEGRRLVFPFVG